MPRIDDIVQQLGGHALVPGVHSAFDLDEATRRGLSAESVCFVADKLALGKSDVSRFFAVSERTLRRRMNDHEPVNLEVSDLAVRLARVLAHAIEVLESEAAATAWLRSPVRALGGRRPLELLTTDIGTSLVDDALVRLDHGVYG